MRDEVAAAWVARTRCEQGLPDEIEDPEALRRLAALLLVKDEAPGFPNPGARTVTTRPLAKRNVNAETT